MHSKWIFEVENKQKKGLVIPFGVHRTVPTSQMPFVCFWIFETGLNLKLGFSIWYRNAFWVSVPGIAIRMN